MYNEVIKFWFEDVSESNWFRSSEDFDKTITSKFYDIHSKAANCELFQWRETALGSLAEILILDQFSRNIFRGKPEAFSHDNLALALAQSAIDRGVDNELPEKQRSFLYLPFMHSESPIIHEEAVKLFTALGSRANLDYEFKHKAIIDQFGRYPHRNDVLGRVSTPEELEFLETPGSSF